MTNALTNLQRTKREVMKGLHAVYGFNFEKPYRAVEVCGSTTVKALEKAVCADKDDVVVALVAEGSFKPHYNAVELSPYYAQGFDIEKAKRIFTTKNVNFANAFGNFYSKRSFSDARSAYDAKIIVVAQNKDCFFNRCNTEAFQTRLINKALPKSVGVRYQITERSAERSYGTSFSMRTYDRNDCVVHATAYKDKGQTVEDYIDKSGFLVYLYREELRKRAEKRKAMLAKSAFLAKDFSERVIVLREVVNARKNALAESLAKASTVEDVRKVRDAISYWHGLIDIMQDFEEFEKNVKNKSFASIAECDALYNSILKNATTNSF